jgi:predicted membrane-bound spermidine synthase
MPSATSTLPPSQGASHQDPIADPRAKPVLLGYSTTVFVSSALLLVLEIVAGRLAAPYVGVSLYTWTSIIGVILAGLSLGNWLGGLWADHGGNGRSVGTVLLAAGIYCLLSLSLLDPLGATLQRGGISLLGASFGFAAALFFVPAALIGVVTPLLTTLALRLDSRTGHVVGRMHALAAVGSILGTFVAGWVLVQWLGSRMVVLVCALLLVALALPFLRGVHRALWVLVGLLLLLSAGLGVRSALAGSCDRESSYFCMRVVDQSALAPFGEARGLVLDHLLHGINHRQDPALLIAPYVHAIDELAFAHFGADYDAGLRWFFAGGGAYSQPRALTRLSPDSEIVVAELDPQVTLLATESLFLEPESMEIIHRDARLALRDQPRGHFDVVVGDVFHDVAIPQHLVTREFAALVRERLTPDGIYLMNVVDSFPDPRLIKTIAKTLATEFAHVDLWMQGVPEDPRVTFIVTATNAERLPRTIEARTGPPRRWSRMTEDILAFGTPPALLPVLSDDYAPVERLIADLLIGDQD